eukprot:m.739164 g.739164  ORF g.739164 m.739164 type:complete len:304 (+) comp58918_c0_seq12:999-1910(+)
MRSGRVAGLLSALPGQCGWGEQRRRTNNPKKPNGHAISNPATNMKDDRADGREQARGYDFASVLVCELLFSQPHRVCGVVGFGGKSPSARALVEQAPSRKASTASAPTWSPPHPPAPHRHSTASAVGRKSKGRRTPGFDWSLPPRCLLERAHEARLRGTSISRTSDRSSTRALLLGRLHRTPHSPAPSRNLLRRAYGAGAPTHSSTTRWRRSSANKFSSLVRRRSRSRPPTCAPAGDGSLSVRLCALCGRAPDRSAHRLDNVDRRWCGEPQFPAHGRDFEPSEPAAPVFGVRCELQLPRRLIL